MNTQERLLVSRLVTRIAQAPDSPRDPDVQLEIDALQRVRPDAAYRLLQYALVLESELDQAQARLEAAPGRPGVASPSAFARPAGTWDSPAAPGNAPAHAAAPIAPAAPLAFAPAPPPAPPAGGASAIPAATGAGGFLRNAATIGAGVLGGSLLFQGIESLLHGGAGGAGGGGFFSSRQAPVEVIETNNFIEDGGWGRAGRIADGPGAGLGDARASFDDGAGAYDGMGASLDDAGSAFDDVADGSADDDSLA